MGLKQRFKKETYIYIHTMNDPAKIHKLTVFSQLLVELNFQTLEVQLKIIKATGEEDLRTMLLNRYLEAQSNA